MQSIPLQNWPYPRWIAHRGAGKLAPENTLAAFKLGASFGYTMFECDAKLSADGELFLLHDATLERTTNGIGVAGEKPWQELVKLDAGSWHSPPFVGEKIPNLKKIIQYCLENKFFLNIEIKPTPGQESETGQAVAALVKKIWPADVVPPLLSSFQPAALAAAQKAAPELPRGLLIDELRPTWIQETQSLAATAVIFNYRLWNPETYAQAKSAGLRTLCYTVNDAAEAARLLALGLDGLITDKVDVFKPRT